MPTKLTHGAYARDSKYEVVQHRYAASGFVAYVECLEVVNPPDGKPRYIIHWYYIQNATFPGDHSWYFSSLRAAQEAWEKFWSQSEIEPRERFKRQAGFINYEYNGSDSPWYYIK